MKVTKGSMLLGLTLIASSGYGLSNKNLSPTVDTTFIPSTDQAVVELGTSYLKGDLKASASGYSEEREFESLGFGFDLALGVGNQAALLLEGAGYQKSDSNQGSSLSTEKTYITTRGNSDITIAYVKRVIGARAGRSNLDITGSFEPRSTSDGNIIGLAASYSRVGRAFTAGGALGIDYTLEYSVSGETTEAHPTYILGGFIQLGHSSDSASEVALAYQLSTKDEVLGSGTAKRTDETTTKAASLDYTFSHQHRPNHSINFKVQLSQAEVELDRVQLGVSTSAESEGDSLSLNLAYHLHF